MNFGDGAQMIVGKMDTHFILKVEIMTELPLLIAIAAMFILYYKHFTEHPEDFKNPNK